MNKNNLGPILVGALIGAGLGYLVADWYIDTYIPEEGYEVSGPDQISKFEKRMSKKHSLATPNLNREANGLPKVRNYTELFQSQQRPDLAVLAAKYNGKIDESEDVEALEELLEQEQDLEEAGLALDLAEEEALDETEDMDDDGNDPGIISVAVYAEDQEHTHTTLRYFNDDVLTDEANVPVNRPERFLPANALDSFGYLSKDPDIVYVRNSEKKCMYEIVRMDTSYSSAVMGSGKRNKVKTKEMGFNGEEADS